MSKKVILTGAFAFVLIGSMTAQAELVGEWNFDAQSFANSGTAGSVHDGALLSGGTGNFSTDTHNGSGYSLQFTGADDDVLLIDNSKNTDAGYLSTFDNSTGFTISMWMKTEVADSWVRWEEFGGKGNEGAKSGWSLRSETDERVWFTDYDGGGNKAYNSSVNVFDTSWHLVTAVYDGTEGDTSMRVYLDGELSRTVGNDLADASAYSLVFGGRDDGSRSGDILLDDIEYYDTALNASEVAALIPEPATLGLVVAFGGGLLFVRRFMQI
ncbi:LamG domain-containing protein [Pontiellaceae bacterium B12219]|nr:LamG domain-containing protein [Pontiellaceae bacterium B12219]